MSAPQITVLDAGGQYCHLIARKVRDLGVYADVHPSETPASELCGRKGLIISGGPASVYDPDSPSVDNGIFSSGQSVLGICYGQQLIAHALGGTVRRGSRSEFGMARLELNGAPETTLFAGVQGPQKVWMSHRDVVTGVPDGFSVLAATDTCAVAAMGFPARGLYGVQFHPEVVHTVPGTAILSNFLFSVCGCTRDWDPGDRIPLIEEQICAAAGDRNIFFFVSGGVDSTVAYTLCVRALGSGRVRGAYVDTGLMRERETEFVEAMFTKLGGTVSVEHAEDQFLNALAGVCDPEEKRRIIGEQFVQVQERIIESRRLLDGHWILGQGTIYPDTIESGGTAKAAVIKTHHNRVAGIQRLLEAGRIVEPLTSFYKDEVREIGRDLGLGSDVLERQPFPGPGLAIRCLCSGAGRAVELIPEGYILPVSSVGVQGDLRSYAPVLALDEFPPADGALQTRATAIVNELPGINRVVARVASRIPLGDMRSSPATLTANRLELLRRADAIVRRISHETGLDERIWQFPVVLIPLGSAEAPDSIVLRPVESTDGMTAQSAAVEEVILLRLAQEILTIPGICAVFHDLSHKPPATIEWE